MILAAQDTLSQATRSPAGGRCRLQAAPDYPCKHAFVPRRRCREPGVVKLRNEATELLFRLLTSPDDIIVTCAQEGLAAVVTDQRSIPKPLLQVIYRCTCPNSSLFTQNMLLLVIGN